MGCHCFKALKDGGTLWFTDLTAADPTFIFPVVTAASFLAMIEVSMRPRKVLSWETVLVVLTRVLLCLQAWC